MVRRWKLGRRSGGEGRWSGGGRRRRRKKKELAEEKVSGNHNNFLPISVPE